MVCAVVGGVRTVERRVLRGLNGRTAVLLLLWNELAEMQTI